MKKNFFTGGKRRLPKQASLKHSNSDENLGKFLYSTDPKDLPDGYTVGSMSAPYVPKEQELEHPMDHGGSQKRKKKHPKEAKASPSLTHVISRPVAVDTGQQASVSPLSKLKRAQRARNLRLQRSCSVDALNEIDGEKDSAPDTPNLTEKDESKPTFYKRGISHNPKGVTPKNAFSGRPLSFHGEQAHLKGSPKLQSQISAQRTLFEPKSVEHLVEALQSPNVDANFRNEMTGDAPIHSIIKKKKKDRVDLLLALLVNSKADINLQNGRDMTALHMAIEAGSEMCARATIAFGADTNKQGCNQFTPLDLVSNSSNKKLSSIEDILKKLGAKTSFESLHAVGSQEKGKKVPRLFSFAQRLDSHKKAESPKANDNDSERSNSVVARLYNELEVNVIRRLSFSASIGGADDTFALVLQQRELALYNKTRPKQKKATNFGLRGGSRILFLDGGGIKGLVELEILFQLEERTRCKITDLFDWIVGTSVGGIIALAMVYGKKSLHDLRQLFFLIKSRVFMKSRYGFGYRSDSFEELLKQYLSPEILMSDVKHPKVLIGAVNKATTNLQLHFFNNCFDDEYTDFPVWKVARYTSAAPMFFHEFEDYVDGGVICNNPTEYGLTAIQNYCASMNINIPIATVVSIGTGVFPAEKIGNVDAQNALFFGKQWLNPGKLFKQTQSLMSLLSNAIGETELVVTSSKSRCKEQGIPFFRFSPKFDELIASGETDNEKLFNMIIKTKLYLKEQEKELDELVNLFLAVAEQSKDLEKEAFPKQRESAHLDHTVSQTIEEEEDEEEDEDNSRIGQAAHQDIPEAKRDHKVEEGEIAAAKSDVTTLVGREIVDEENQDCLLKSNEHLTNQSPSLPVASSSQTSTATAHDATTATAVSLYKPYRADTKEIDQSQDEYTDYKRETLV